jgi:hypothetical protein
MPKYGWQSKNYAKAEKAVNELVDESMLEYIAHEAYYTQIRLLAVEKMSDQRALSNIARDAADADVREAAAQKLTGISKQFFGVKANIIGECKHCRQPTQGYKERHIRFRQAQYEHLYGKNYPKGFKTVDKGVVPVFLCDECVRQFFKKTKLDYARLKLKVSVIALFFAFLVIFLLVINGNLNIVVAKILCILSLCPFFAQVFYEDNRLKKEHEHATQNLRNIDSSSFILIPPVSNGGGLVVGAVAFAGILTSIFMPSAAFPIYAYVLSSVIFIMFLAALFGFMEVKSVMKSDMDGIRGQAISYFFYFDDGIKLE